MLIYILSCYIYYIINVKCMNYGLILHYIYNKLSYNIYNHFFPKNLLNSVKVLTNSNLENYNYNCIDTELYFILSKKNNKQIFIFATQYTTHFLKNCIISTKINKRPKFNKIIFLKNKLHYSNNSILNIKNNNIFKKNQNYTAHYLKIRSIILHYLLSQLGKPYHWGGASPNIGFDCSGLVYYAYKNLVRFPMPRTVYAMYNSRYAIPVQKTDLKKCDLVFFHINTKNTTDHVGVYLGHGRFIQSLHTGRSICISYLNKDYWLHHYVGARRIIISTNIK